MRQPMMRISRTLCSAAVAWTVFASGCRTPDAPPTIETPSAAVPGDALAIALALGRGINLGNILEAPNEGAWGLRLTDDLVAIWRQLAKRDAMKARGFTWAYWQLAAAFGIYQLGTELAGGVAGCAVSLGRT